MKRQTQIRSFLSFLVFAVLAACDRNNDWKRPVAVLHASSLGAITFVPSRSTPFLRWPQFLMVERENRFLWGSGREIFRVSRLANGQVVAEPAAPGLTRELDKLTAAAQSAQGTLALLDTSGQVAVLRPASGQTWSFDSHLKNHSADLAVTEDRVYLLLQSESEDVGAVAAYTFDGLEAGKWGTMPADGIIQTTLRGGGIVSCPDGSIFYSYINSPQIFQLQGRAKTSVRALGRPSSSFQEISAREVHEAYRESKSVRSVAPLVKLGLRGSRVMSLRCSKEGLLLRQVARPARGGAYLELWNPVSETLVGTIRVPEGILFDVRDRILYFGSVGQGNEFTLDRIQFQVEQSPPRRAAER